MLIISRVGSVAQHGLGPQRGSSGPQHRAPQLMHLVAEEGKQRKHTYHLPLAPSRLSPIPTLPHPLILQFNIAP
jgi:hypothetical protein